MDDLAQKKNLNLKSRVQGKNLPHREVRRHMVCRFAWESRVGLAPKRVSCNGNWKFSKIRSLRPLHALAPV